MLTDETFHRAYRELEGRMKQLAEEDGDIYLPNVKPVRPVHYVLICMEPSLGHWARSPKHARMRVEAGFKNFLSSLEDFILHFCARHYLCGPGQRYHVTDISKGAMLVDRAGVARSERYDRWYALLQEELELCAVSNAGIVAVGNAVTDHLSLRGFRRPFTRIIHYSGQAAAARKAGIAGHEDSFEVFQNEVTLLDLVESAEEVFAEARVPNAIRDETLSRLAKGQLTASRKQLMFNYKLAFESLRLETP